MAFRLYDPNGLRNSPGSNANGTPILFSLLKFQYSVDGGGTWRTATSATAISPTMLITPTRLGIELTFNWDAQADKALSEDARFRVSLVQSDETGPVAFASASAVSPPFRVRATTCQWPANVRITTTPSDPAANQTVSLVAQIDASGVVSTSWNLGDGNQAGGLRVAHRYSYGGTYNVTLTVLGESCPIARGQVITHTVRVGAGIPPIFLPVVYAPQQGSRSAPPAVPLAVRGLDGEQAEDGSLTLRWDEPEQPQSVLSYRIYRSVHTGDFVAWDQVGADERRYRDREPACDVAYFVTALGSGGESPVGDRAYYTEPCSGGAE